MAPSCLDTGPRPLDDRWGLSLGFPVSDLPTAAWHSPDSSEHCDASVISKTDSLSRIFTVPPPPLGSSARLGEVSRSPPAVEDDIGRPLRSPSSNFSAVARMPGIDVIPHPSIQMSGAWACLLTNPRRHRKNVARESYAVYGKTKKRKKNMWNTSQGQGLRDPSSQARPSRAGPAGIPPPGVGGVASSSPPGRCNAGRVFSPATAHICLVVDTP